MKRPTTRPSIQALLPLVLAVACGGRKEFYEDAFELDRPIALDAQLLWVDADANEGYLLDVTDDLGPAATTLALPHGFLSKHRRRGKHDEILVLCEGRRGTAKEDAVPAMLVAVQADGDTRQYELGNPFQILKQSSDGRYAFLLKDESATDRLLQNPNEVAIVDLDAKQDDGVTLRALTSFGDSPTDVGFSPPMRILEDDATQRRLAVALSATTVTLIDLDHLDRRETSVQLSVEAGAVNPAQVLFSAQEPTMYVRGDSSDDVFVFHFDRRPEGDDEEEGAHNDFRPSINQLVVGEGPVDMALYEGGDGGERLLVLARDSRELAIVDAASSRVAHVPLPTTQTNILLFQAPAPQDAEIAQRALLWSQSQTDVTFVDLEGVEERLDRNLTSVRLAAPVTRAVPMLDDGLVLFLHAAETVSLLDLAARTVSPISSSVSLSDAEFDATRRNLWVAPSDQPRVGYLDLDAKAPGEVLLDANVEAFVPLFAWGHVAVVHDDVFGHVTVLDVQDPSRESARAIRGFMLADVLDRGSR
jgi:hypothetical protein